MLRSSWQDEHSLQCSGLPVTTYNTILGVARCIGVGLDNVGLVLRSASATLVLRSASATPVLRSASATLVMRSASTMWVYADSHRRARPICLEPVCGLRTSRPQRMRCDRQIGMGHGDSGSLTTSRSWTPCGHTIRRR